MLPSAGPDQLNTTEQLNSTVTRLFVRLRDHLVEQGASVPQARVLSRLRDRGPTRITDLATAMQVSQPTMTAQVQRLELLQWVGRTVDDSDGRAVLVALTDTGRCTLAALSASRAALLHAGLDQLQPADREAIDAALPALQRLADTLAEHPDA